MMARMIAPDYNQIVFLPPSVEDWVGQDHPVRFIRDLTASMDLESEGFAVPRVQNGRPPYSPRLLLAVWVYGYFEKIRSCRALEKACRDSMSFIWLTGNNPPDHNTLWRFFKSNAKAMKGLFKKSVRVAVDADFVSFALQAVDGTKIRSQSSASKLVTREELERLDRELERSIDQMMEQVERSEREEFGSINMPQALVDAQERRSRITEALRALDDKKDGRVNPDEAEARVMRCGEGLLPAYNAQAVVESDNRFIVAADVTDSANDRDQLSPMLESAAETTGRAADMTVADKGYYNSSQLAKAEEQGTAALVAIPSPPKDKEVAYPKSAFVYDEQTDTLVCPEGSRLTFRYMKTCRSANKARVYRCANRDCPHRGECTIDKDGRSVEMEPGFEASGRHRALHQEEKYLALLNRRKDVAELPFAWIKNHMGFRRWTLRGLERVRAQWFMLCATSNIKILYGFWKRGQLPESALKGA
jgi:transposase